MKNFIKNIFSLYRQEIFIIGFSFLIILAFIPVFTYIYFAHDLQSKESLMNRNDTGLILLDRTGKPFFTFYQAKFKNYIPLSQIPVSMQNALIASEDKDFYSHPGFSVKGIVRSMIIDVLHTDTVSGGSTITQQLVKNALLTSHKSFLRKYQEIVLAAEIERRYSKKEILEMYLNSVYFGEGAFGIENAALVYFGKHAQDLDVAQSALLTAILPSPSNYSPLSGGFSEAKKLQGVVLTKMREQHYISSSEESKLQQEKLLFSSQKETINSQAAHFALMVRDELIKKYGEERISRSGFRVKTTLNGELQAYAEQTVAQDVAKLTINHVSNGAAVVIDPKNGEILSLVGSKNWYDMGFGKVNMAITPRSVGSSFKPLVYAAALEARLISPATLLSDSPTTFPGNYKPLDYDRKFRGKVTVRRALANSLNIPSVEVMSRVGISPALEIAQRFGITTLTEPSAYGLSLVLGTGEVKLTELTNAFAIFASQGVKYPVTDILEVDDKNGKQVYAYSPKGKSVVSKEVSFLISSILSDNRARAEEFGTALTISRLAAVKTGTAEDYKDALTVGYTPSVVVGVWVGNNDNSPMDKIAGSLGAAPIWKALMEKSLSGTAKETFSPPPGITSLTICSDGGIARVGQSGVYKEYFISGTEPKRFCAPRITSSPSPTFTPTP